jgi:hypothetical protein
MAMEPVSESLRLLKRQADIERRRRQPGRISILDERELFAVRARLADFPGAVRVIAELIGARRHSLDQVRVENVERWAARG